MAAPSYRSSSSDSVLGGTSVSPSKPTGTTTDDILLAGVGIDSTSASISTVPTGFVLIDTQTQGGVSAGRVYWKRAGASEPAAYDWERSSSGSLEVIMVAVSGCETDGSPIDVYATNGDTTGNPIHSSITTTVADTFLWAWGMCDTLRNWTPPSGYTERVDGDFSWASDSTQAAIGATGDKTTSGSSPDWVTFHIALMEPQGAGDPEGPLIGGKLIGGGILMKGRLV